MGPFVLPATGRSDIPVRARDLVRQLSALGMGPMGLWNSQTDRKEVSSSVVRGVSKLKEHEYHDYLSKACSMNT